MYRNNFEQLMHKFNFDQFLIDKRLEMRELRDLLGVSIVGVYKMKNRGTIKPSTLRKLEEVYGDCSQYLHKEKAEVA